MSICEGNKHIFGKFTDPTITITMGQTDPQHEWLIYRRMAKNTAFLTSLVSSGTEPHMVHQHDTATHTSTNIRER